MVLSIDRGMKKLLAVLVTGATGRQGGAVARALLAHGHRVRALTREPHGVAAGVLLHLGVELWRGDFDDGPSKLASAMEGVTAVFAMGTPSVSAAAERRQGYAVIDAAVRADVGHLVYSSAAGADWAGSAAGRDSKYDVEIHLRSAEIANTIVAPTFFMENFVGPPWTARLEQGRLPMPLAPRVQLEMVTAGDLGAFVVKIFEQRDDFLSKRIVVSSDVLTGVEIAGVISGCVGAPIVFERLPVDRTPSDETANVLRWLARDGARLGIADLHEAHPDIDWTSFSDWATRQRWPTNEDG